MQAPEGGKDSLRIRLRETEAVISNRECPFVGAQLSGNMNSGRLVFPPVLNRVADQVQEDLTKLLAVEGHWGKFTVRYNSATVIDGCPEIPQCLLESRLRWSIRRWAHF